MNSKTSKIMLIAGMHVAVIGGLLLFESCKPTHKTRSAVVTPPPGAPAAAVVPTEVTPPPPVPVTPVMTAPAIETKPAIAMGPVARATSSYTVVKGDTLSGIAHKNGTTVTALKQANNMSSDTIRVGQKLTVPSPQESGQKVAAPHKTVHKKTGKAAPKKASAEAAAAAVGGQYVVEKGDQPVSIAKKLGIKTQELLDANPGLDPKKLQIGQKLNVPGAPAAAAPAGGIPAPAAGAPVPAPTVPSPSLPEPPPAAPSIPVPPPSAPSTPAPGQM